MLTDERMITLTPSQSQNLSQLNVPIADGNNVFADRFCLTTTQKEANLMP
jgi:protein involved in ribonucleotide reduction